MYLAENHAQFLLNCICTMIDNQIWLQNRTTIQSSSIFLEYGQVRRFVALFHVK